PARVDPKYSVRPSADSRGVSSVAVVLNGSAAGAPHAALTSARVIVYRSLSPAGCSIAKNISLPSADSVTSSSSSVLELAPWTATGVSHLPGPSSCTLHDAHAKIHGASRPRTRRWYSEPPRRSTRDLPAPGSRRTAPAADGPLPAP